MHSEENQRKSIALHFGIILNEYPRNRRMREFLSARLKFDNRILTVDDKPGYLRKALMLIKSSLTQRRGTVALVVVPEFSLKYAAFAWVIAKYHRAPLVVDWFVGLYETRVGDWASPLSLRARLLKGADTLALKLADVAVTDTEMRADMLVRHYGAKRRPLVLPVGAPAWAVYNSPTLCTKFRILYYGSYLPLHGIDFFLESLTYADARNYEITFIGQGNLRPQVEKRIDELGLRNLFTFIDYVPEEFLAAHIADSDLILGIYGSSSKASTVIANKIWQALSCGRPVITRSSEALSEIRSLAGDFLIEIDSPRELAKCLNSLERRDLAHVNESAAKIGQHLEAYVTQMYEVFFLELQFILQKENLSNDH